MLLSLQHDSVWKQYTSGAYTPGTEAMGFTQSAGIKTRSSA